MSVRQFEIKIGASNGAISKAIKQGTDIQSKWLSKIIYNYTDINPSWLVNGEGEMLRSASKFQEPSLSYLTKQNDQLEAMQQKMDSLVLKINRIKDSSEIKLITSDMYQLFNELMEQYHIQKDRLAEKL